MVFLFILVASFLLQMVLPWWVIIVVCFATCGLIGKTARVSFWQSFLAILILWAGMALYKSMPNNHILATRVSEMFGVKFWPVLLTLTSLLGGLVAGICGYCGHHFRKSIIAMKPKV